MKTETKKTNLLHITFSLGTGGLEVLLLDVLRNLDRSRFSPMVCTMQPNGRLNEEFGDAGIPVFTVEKKEGIDYSLPYRLAMFFKDKKVDIVHTHNTSPWLYAGIATMFFKNVRLFHTQHSYHQVLGKNKLMLAERLLSKISSKIIADSQDVADFMMNREKILPDKIRVIYNGIDTGKFVHTIDSSAKRKEFEIDEADKVIGVVARLVPIKDHATLLMAFKVVTQRVKAAKLLIVGDGECREELIRLTEELGLGGSVKFLGLRRDIQDLMKVFDLFVLSSLSEGCSITLMEAMSSGLPVVTTSVGGNPEIVVHGDTGLLVPPQRPDELAGRICEVLEDPALARTLGANGRKRACGLFSITNVVKEYQGLYDAVC